MNFRCRIINYLRKRFPRVDPKTRRFFLKRLELASTIFQMLPLLGCDFLFNQDYSRDQCIFSGTNSCCMMMNKTSDSDIPLMFDALKHRYASEFAVSEIIIYIYKGCITNREFVSKKPRMRYTSRFVE